MEILDIQDKTYQLKKNVVLMQGLLKREYAEVKDFKDSFFQIKNIIDLPTRQKQPFYSVPPLHFQ